MMPSCRNLLLNLSLLCGTILLFFGGIEFALRVTGLVKMQDYTPPIYERSENPAISYTLKPNVRKKAFRNWVTTDENGFRLTPTFKPSNLTSTSLSTGQTLKPLVAILGDSVTFGYGVANEETFPAQLQKLLPETTVINAGVPGYNITQEAAFFEEKLAPLQPDALVLVFYWNDFEQGISWLDDKGNLRPEGWKPTEKICDPVTRGILGLIPGKCWLDLHSAFYKAVKEFVNTRSAIVERDQKREEVAPKVTESITDADLQYYAIELQKLSPLAPKKRFFVIWPDAELHEDIKPKLTILAEQNGFTIIDLYKTFGNAMETLSWDYIHPSAPSLARAAGVIAKVLLQ